MGQKSKNAGKKKSKTCDKPATTRSISFTGKGIKVKHLSVSEATWALVEEAPSAYINTSRYKIGTMMNCLNHCVLEEDN